MDIVEFTERICRSKLTEWQKEALIKIRQLDRPVYICMVKNHARTEMMEAAKQLMDILYGSDVKGE